MGERNQTKQHQTVHRRQQPRHNLVTQVSNRALVCVLLVFVFKFIGGLPPHSQARTQVERSNKVAPGSKDRNGSWTYRQTQKSTQLKEKQNKTRIKKQQTWMKNTHLK